MNHKKIFSLNLIAQFAVFASNMGINFFLTPYVLEKLGEEAYGFIGLINNFVSYVTIITTALNSLAGRYITLAYHQGKQENAKEYFTSVFYANLVLSVAVLIASFLLNDNVAGLLNVPAHLLTDVKITIWLSAINTIISLISVVYGVSAFIKNKLYLNSIAQMIAAIARVILIVVMFLMMEAHMWYYVFTAIFAALISLGIQKRITKSLCPEFVIHPRYYRWSRVLSIIKNGVWVSLESFNKLLQTGLDLLISNLYVSAAATGLFSVAKTVPNVLTQITGVISTVFNPELAQFYAENRKKELVESFQFTIRFLSMVMIVPLVGFIVFGQDFYALWLPYKTTEEISLIQTLSILTVLPLLVNAYVEGLYYANTLTNKIKGSVLITFAFSASSILVELVLLVKLDANPLYIIAGTSSFFMIIRYFLVTPIYAAYVLKLPLLTFFPTLVRAVALSVALVGLFMLVDKCYDVSSWGQMVLQCGLCGLGGYIFTIFGLFNEKERKQVLDIVKKKFIRKR